MEKCTVKKESYRDRIMAILNAHDGPMGIAELREPFGKSIKDQAGVSSCLRNMKDAGEIKISGGGHSNSMKTVETVPHFAVPIGRIIRLSDARHWNDGPIRSRGTPLQSGMTHLAIVCG